MIKILQKQIEFFREEVQFDYKFRLELLNRLEEAIENNQEKIYEALKKDLHKSSFESFTTETGIVLHEIRFIKNNLKKWMKKTRVKTPQKLLFFSTSYYESVPRGQVLIFAPWNYPFNLIFSPLVGALAAGNTVVIKPSEHAPHMEKLIKEMIKETFPEKIVAVITGDEKVADELLTFDWDMIFFTGSTAVGRHVAMTAAEKLTPAILELGGKCPVIVSKNSNLKIVAKRIIWAKLLNAGQTCLAPDYLLVEEKAKRSLLKHLQNAIEEMYGENQMESGAYGRIINKKHFERVKKLLENTNIVFGGNTSEEDFYIQPTIVDDVQPEHPLMKEEIFGPILPVMSYNSLEDACLFINRYDPALAVYVYTQSAKEFYYVKYRTKSGSILRNDGIIHLANPRLPFGGVRQSGIGRYHGKFSFDAFSYLRPVLNHRTCCDAPLRYPPYTEKKWKAIKHLLK